MRLLNILWSLFFISVFACIVSCKKDDKFKYIVEGQVKNARNGNAISAAYVEMQQQVITSGTFNTNFTMATATSSDGSGAYHLEWERETVAMFRLKAEKENYFDRYYQISPDQLDVGDSYSKTVQLYPVATIEVHAYSEAPEAKDDQLLFRWEEANFDCDCCNENWITLDDPGMDTVFSCQLYGDQWLKYVRDFTTGSLDTVIVDSIWVPAFQTTTLNIAY